jgi:general secretion pathway protein A
VYTEFFGLNEKPFSITPDPRYLFLTDRHADALAHLIYGISESGGFIQLTGEVGTGKTTLIRSLLEQMPADAKVAVILNPNLTAREFLGAICTELQIPLPAQDSRSALIGALNEFLLNAHASGTRVVLIVDEAQTLDADLLEQVRLLTNLETAKQKLLQIILIGQPELRDLLNRSDMRQVAQRITGRFHLEPLSRRDTAAYVAHRMKVAGSHAEVFKPSAMRSLFRRSGGIPRLINVIADRALLAGYTLDTTKIDGRLVRRAAGEVFGRAHRRWPYPAIGVLIAIAVLVWLDFVPLEAPTGPDVALTTSPPNEPEPTLDPPAEPAVSRATVDGLLATVTSAPAEDDPDAPLRALLRAWGFSIETDVESPCALASIRPLNCLAYAEGTVDALRAADKPVVVSLTAPDGRGRSVLLDAIDGTSVTVEVADAVHALALEEFATLWDGRYVVLWNAPPPPDKTLALGDLGEDVVWLRKALASIYGRPLLAHGAPAKEFDLELEYRVREYQRDRTLAVDGVVGTETRAALRTDLGIESPARLGRRG